MRVFLRTGLAVLGLAVLLTVLVAVRWRPLVSFDVRVAGALHRHALAHPGFTRVNRLLSDWVWDPWTMRLLAAAAVLWLLRRGDRRRALYVAVVTLLATGVQHALKALVGRSRPRWPDPVASAEFAAYPSGHAMTAAVVCGLLLWACGRPPWAVVLAAVSVLGVGFTRVYLGVHWPSDVLGGWLLGAALVCLAAAAYERPRARRTSA
ncbi:phosphatase PAP2 family protein [Streptomyces sp. NPDC101118]|uniref:phosphatase PAP2 family protein n=1 Tax=Streptomyces sp. NPDC101118 TaxID=3366109 RepID=UPI003805867A